MAAVYWASAGCAVKATWRARECAACWMIYTHYQCLIGGNCCCPSHLHWSISLKAGGVEETGDGRFVLLCSKYEEQAPSLVFLTVFNQREMISRCFFMHRPDAFMVFIIASPLLKNKNYPNFNLNTKSKWIYDKQSIVIPSSSDTWLHLIQMHKGLINLQRHRWRKIRSFSKQESDTQEGLWSLCPMWIWTSQFHP